jgi:hypothetical protein
MNSYGNIAGLLRRLRLPNPYVFESRHGGVVPFKYGGLREKQEAALDIGLKLCQMSCWRKWDHL